MIVKTWRWCIFDGALGRYVNMADLEDTDRYGERFAPLRTYSDPHEAERDARRLSDVLGRTFTVVVQ